MTANNQPIDFLPDDVVHVRHEQAQYAILLKVSTSLLILTIVVSVSIFIYRMTIQKELISAKSEVQNQLDEIASMKNIAETGYTLGIRLSSLKEILRDRILYSKLMTEIANSTPSVISVDDIVLDSVGDLTLTGTAKSADYTPIAEFKDMLTKNKDVFSNVQVLSVSGNNESINFSISVKIKFDTLKDTDFKQSEEQKTNDSNVNQDQVQQEGDL